MEEIILTDEGKRKILEELDDLVKVKQPAAREKLKVAREQGDLSENADYDLARDEMSRIADRIRELEETLKYAKFINSDAIDTTVVSVGCFVKIHDLEYDEIEEYQIVGSAEANFVEKKISNESPIGAALIGHKENDVVEINAPAGVSQFKVLSIHK